MNNPTRERKEYVVTYEEYDGDARRERTVYRPRETAAPDDPYSWWRIEQFYDCTTAHWHERGRSSVKAPEVEVREFSGEVKNV